ncbi:MAG: hypothetical protein WAW96_09805 [Alphaproteobacteria bacterium]
MKDVLGALAKAGASFLQWIASLGPYSWSEVVFVFALTISVVVGVFFAIALIARRNRAIEFVDQSEVITSPLRNRAEPVLTAIRRAPAPTESEKPILLTDIATASATKTAASPAVVAAAAEAAPIKTTPIRAQLVLKPLGAGSGNVAEIAHANAITQRLKIVLGALAPHIAVERNAEAFGNLGKIDRYVLTGAVRHMGDRIRLQVDMADARTGANLFHFRYQGLPSEQDVMLAEITSRVLKATSHPAPDRKSNAA